MLRYSSGQRACRPITRMRRSRLRREPQARRSHALLASRRRARCRCGRFDAVAWRCFLRRSRSSPSCRSPICFLRPAPSWVSGSCICRLLGSPCCLRSLCTRPQPPRRQRASGGDVHRRAHCRGVRDENACAQPRLDERRDIVAGDGQRGPGQREGASRPGGSAVRRGPDPRQHRRGDRGGRQERGAARRPDR